MTHRPLGTLYLVFAACLGGLLVLLWPWALPLAWVAATYTVVGLAYLLGKPAWLGKRDDGSLSTPYSALMLPYLPLAIVAAWVRRETNEPAWNKVAPKLYVGRRVRAADLPADVGAVVDLTSEFSEPVEIRQGRIYRCLPTMDGCASDPNLFAALATEISGWPHATYIHCAVGHGRSAALAAAVMVLRGQAKNADEAEALMRRARPGIGLKAAQKRVVDALRRT